jgi:hypothetical protein
MIATLQEVKDYLGISGNADDSFLETQARLVSDAIEGYTKRLFNLRTYTQTFYRADYPRTYDMLLAVYPVVSIASFTQGSDLLTDYILHKPSGILKRTEGFYWDNTVVVYDAGFAQADIPMLVKSVVFEVVGERYNKKKSGVALNFGNDVQRVSIPGTISIDFDYTLSNNEEKTPYGAIIGNYLNVLAPFKSDRAIMSGKLEYVSY